MSRADGEPAGSRRQPLPEQAARWLHWLALGSFAVLQPLLDRLGDSPTFLVHHGATWRNVVVLLILLSLGLPTLLWLVQAAAASVSDRFGRAVQDAGVAVAAALVALPPLRRSGLGDAGVVVAALLAGALVAFLYRRFQPARTYLSVLALGALVFPAFFLSGGPVRAALASGSADVAAHPASVPRLQLDRPVVIVLFDELPLRSLTDERWQIDGSAFPGFARLAATSTWFRNFTTSHNETIGALPALLTGVGVGRAPPVTFASHPRNLLAAVPADQRHAIFESETRFLDVAPEPGIWGSWRLGPVLADLGAIYCRVVLPSSWTTTRLPDVEQQWGHFWSRGEGPRSAPLAIDADWAIDERAGRFSRFLERLGAAEGAGLSYAHVMLPHAPWQVLPSGRLYEWRGLEDRHEEPASLSRIARRAADPVYLRFERQRHLLQVQFADLLLAKLLERLEELGRFDDAVVVVLSDHGRSFEPGSDGRSLDRAPDPADVVRVPLFVKESGQRRARVIDRNVESIDFLATLSAAAGFELPWPTDGESGFLDGPGRPTKICRDRLGNEHRFPATLDAADSDARPEATPEPVAGDSFRFFRLGPYGELVGRSLEGLAVESDGRVEVALSGGADLAKFDPSASHRPVYLLGRARWPRAAPTAPSGGAAGGPPGGLGSVPALPTLHLAFALAGRIVAVTETLAPVAAAAGFEGEVLVLLPETELAAGRNELTVYALGGSSEAPSLRPASLEWR